MRELYNIIYQILADKGFELFYSKNPDRGSAALKAHWAYDSEWRTIQQHLCTALMARFCEKDIDKGTTYMGRCTIFSLPLTCVWKPEKLIALIVEHALGNAHLQAVAKYLREATIINYYDIQHNIRDLSLISADYNRHLKNDLLVISMLGVLYSKPDAESENFIVAQPRQIVENVVLSYFGIVPVNYEADAYSGGYLCDTSGKPIKTGTIDVWGHLDNENIEHAVRDFYRLRKLKALL